MQNLLTVLVFLGLAPGSLRFLIRKMGIVLAALEVPAIIDIKFAAQKLTLLSFLSMLTIITMVISKHNNPMALGQGLGSGWLACLSSGSALVALSCCFRILLELQGASGRE